MNKTQEKAYQDFTFDDLEFIELEELKLASEKAEIMALNIDSIFDKTTDKTFGILAIISTLFVSSSTYFFINNDLKGVFNPKLFTVLITSIFLLSICVYLLKNIISVTYMPLGSDPSIILHKKQYETYEENEYRIKSMYFNHLVNVKEQINVNDSYSKERSDRINNSVYATLFTPLIGLIIYLITSLLC